MSPFLLVYLQQHRKPPTIPLIPPEPTLAFDIACQVSTTTMSATKAQSQKIFEKLKTKPANRVKAPRQPKKPLSLKSNPRTHANSSAVYSYALTAAPRIQHGRRCLSVSTYVWIVRLIIVTSVSISPSFAPQTSTVCLSPVSKNRRDCTDSCRMAMGTTPYNESRRQ